MDSDAPPQEPATNRVLTAVADEEDVDPRELEPLYTAIDPDALESLFRDGSGTVMFEYCDFIVTDDHEDSVAVTPLDTERTE